VKFTKPAARYLAKSAHESLRWARRYERSIKLNMSSPRPKVNDDYAPLLVMPQACDVALRLLQLPEASNLADALKILEST
jgi:hypothetical protein